MGIKDQEELTAKGGEGGTGANGAEIIDPDGFVLTKDFTGKKIVEYVNGKIVSVKIVGLSGGGGGGGFDGAGGSMVADGGRA